MTRLPAILLSALLACQACYGATTNFAMRGNFSPEFIAKAEQQAEHCRKTLAIEWLGTELPAWGKPCTVELVNGGGTGGATFFGFDANGKGFDFEGKWQGDERGILEDAIPHEVLHTVLASHIGRVPRWADEGAAMNAETFAGVSNFATGLHERLIDQNVGGFTIDQLFGFAEYPKDFVKFYGQSHSVVKFLIQHNGKRGFVTFLEDAIRGNDYTPALTQHFGLTEDTLQVKWLEWYSAGQPKSPDQLGIRSVSYQGPCRYIWSNGRWVQQCEPQLQAAQPKPPPQNAQPLQQQPLPPVPPKPVKGCTCDEAALIARITKLEAELLLIKNTKPLPGPAGPEGKQGPAGPQGAPGKDAQPPAIDAIVSEVVKQTKPCECNSQDDAATRPGQPVYFDIKPRKR